MAEQKGVDVRLVGYRTDIADYYNAADAYILPSFREGLNVSLLEAMASHLPCLVSRIRGNVDLIDDEKGGYLFNPKSPEEIKKSIIRLIDNNLRNEMGLYNYERVKDYDEELVSKQIKEIYEHCQ